MTKLVDDWSGEWKGELVGGVRRIQKSDYYDSLQNDQHLTPITTLKDVKSKQYDKALRKIDFHIKSNFMKYNTVFVYQDLLPDGVQIEDTALHERIRKQGYSLEVVYGLVGEVDKLVIGGW